MLIYLIMKSRLVYLHGRGVGILAPFFPGSDFFPIQWPEEESRTAAGVPCFTIVENPIFKLFEVQVGVKSLTLHVKFM